MTEPKLKLRDLVEDFDTAMFVTSSEQGPPQVRPLAVVDTATQGELRFAVDRDSSAAAQVKEAGQAAVSFQSKRRFVTLRGAAELDDRIDISRSVWSERLRLWFPIGPTSPHIITIRFLPTEGEYWDLSGMQGVRLVFDAVRAYAKRDTMPARRDRHAAVTF